MRHRVGYNPLGRKAAHRRAMMKNMATSVLRYERIRTTTPKAKEVRKLVEKLITRAKIDSVHNRRIVAQTIADKAVLAKLFVDIGPRFETRPGGYTRILKIGQRRGDAANMAILELVGEHTAVEKKRAKKEARKAESASEQTVDAEVAVAEADEPLEETKDTDASAESEADEKDADKVVEKDS
jgi:large subunit ribosomal protein L17